MDATKEALRYRLNLETGKLTWAEAERFFAKGVLVKVAMELDFIDVATAMAADDKAAVSAWMQAGLVARADTEDAIRWHATQAEFWAVVVAPWVLVQQDG